MKKKIALVFFSSVLLFLLTCWSAGLNLYAAGFTESVCFFVLTYYVLQKFAESDIINKNAAAVTAIIIGRIILEIPIRIGDFRGSFYSLGITIVTVVSILLAALCFKEKRSSVFILSAIIIVLINTVGLYAWDISINQFLHR
jgi:hypothetical protein